MRYGQDGYIVVQGKRLYHSHFNLQWIDCLIPFPNVILDVGAFDGGDSIRFKHHCPQADVYAIEACPERYKLLEKLKSEGIKPFHFAVLNKIGKVEFYQSTDLNQREIDSEYGSCGSVLKATEEAKQRFNHVTYFDTPVIVPCITIEEFCKIHGVGKIDLLHIDVEGVAKEVLEGLGHQRPTLINVEIDAVEKNYVGASTQKEVDNILFPLGYEVLVKSSDSLYFYSLRRNRNET